jgi:predicted RNA binding protein YcfA (HicA-like mRNA interferase family)
VKLPRDVSGHQLAKALARFGYTFDRQRGSHMRFTTERNGEHHVAIPDHDFVRIGTLSDILHDVAAHHNLTIEQLLEQLNL